MYSEIVKYFRKYNHLTQEELAERLNVNITVDYLLGLDNSDTCLDHVVLKKFHVKNELEHSILSQVTTLTTSQQEKLRNILTSLKDFNRGE